MDWILVKTVNFVNNLKNLLYLVFKKKKKTEESFYGLNTS
jgi:hypothetical protein